jgi:hypothetical protein
MKKIIFFAVILVLAGAGFFYWWQNQADVRELNKTLPEGVKVAKSIFGDEYRVVNKIDEYEFKVPPEWKDIELAVYMDITNDELSYRYGFGQELKNIIIYEGALGIQDSEQHQIELRTLKIDKNLDMETLVNEFGSTNIPQFKTMKFTLVTNELIVNNMNVLKLSFVGKSSWGSELTLAPYYFLRGEKKVYVLFFDTKNEEVMREIISNGKW